jgi:hypothetical protein
VRTPPGNDLILGNLGGRKATLALSKTQRDKHLYICGGTGTGKSKFLEPFHRKTKIAFCKDRAGALATNSATRMRPREITIVRIS